MADRTRPALASITIRRLVLPEGETGHGIGEAIAAALAREPGALGPPSAAPAGVAQAIAHRIANHPAIGLCRDGEQPDA